MPIISNDLGTLGPACAGLMLSKAEFLAHDDWDDGYRYELIAGVLIVSPAAAAGERYPNDQLGNWLWNYQANHPAGKCVDGTAYECHLFTDRAIRRTDRSIYTGLGRPPSEKTDIPTIVVEFVSEGRRNVTRDYFEKRDEYLAIGVQEYWVIDRFDRTLTVFTGPVEKPQLRQFPATENYTTPLLPGFELPLAKLFAIADQHSQ